MNEKVYVLMQGDNSSGDFSCVGVYTDLVTAATLYSQFLLVNNYNYGRYDDRYGATSKGDLPNEVYRIASTYMQEDAMLSDKLNGNTTIQLQKVTLV